MRARASIINFVALLAGFIAMVTVTAAGLWLLMASPAPEHVRGAFAVTWGLAGAALVTGAVVRVLFLVALVRVFRGAQAFDWCWPAECVSLADWICTSWRFNAGAAGRQQGLRVFGLGIAIEGHHGQKGSIG